MASVRTATSIRVHLREAEKWSNITSMNRLAATDLLHGLLFIFNSPWCSLTPTLYPQFLLCFRVIVNGRFHSCWYSVTTDVHDLSKRSSDAKERIPTYSRADVWHFLSPLVVVDLFLVARHYTITHWHYGGMGAEHVKIKVQNRGEGLAQHDSSMGHRWLWEGVIQRNATSILLPCTQ